ncbi:DUF2493 domain-containing protein [Streptomyces sp. NPDC059340]|uniref:DUF2493 domain-containing protein n=1 Tax=Streptomyces sp. NPDC059340 TaxID=3346806 RepID=UPI003695CF6B
MNPYRILVTGSREWDDRDRIWLELGNAVSTVDINREIVIVHGDCPRGADAIADQWGRKYGATIERHPANWQINGKRAGFIRNDLMVNLGADLCIAFIRNGSRGASHTAALAEHAGIPTRRWAA